MKAQDKAKELVEANETSKQKAIREAYGLEYIHSDINGWMKYGMYVPNDLGFDNDEIDRHGDMFLWRPKSLQGIENNNGWVKIENEADLPKESCDLFIIRNNKIEIANYSFQYKGWFCKGSYYSDNYKNLNITYYQIIQKPKPPLY